MKQKLGIFTALILTLAIAGSTFAANFQANNFNFQTRTVNRFGREPLTRFVSRCKSSWSVCSGNSERCSAKLRASSSASCFCSSRICLAARALIKSSATTKITRATAEAKSAVLRWSFSGFIREKQL